MAKPPVPKVWAAAKTFSFQPSDSQQEQGFDYIATVRPGTGAPITDDHDWPLKQLTTAVKWLLESYPDNGYQLTLSGDATGSVSISGASQTLNVTVVDNSHDHTISNVTGLNEALGKMLGVGQSWVDVTSSRALLTTYTNTSNKPIAVMVDCVQSSSASVIITVGGVQLPFNQSQAGGGLYTCSAFAIVPPGSTYSASASALRKWVELK